MNVNVVVGFIAGIYECQVEVFCVYKHTPPRYVVGDGDVSVHIYEAAIKPGATTKASSSSTDTHAPSFLAYWSLSQSYIERAGAEEATWRSKGGALAAHKDTTPSSLQLHNECDDAFFFSI